MSIFNDVFNMIVEAAKPSPSSLQTLYTVTFTYDGVNHVGVYLGCPEDGVMVSAKNINNLANMLHAIHSGRLAETTYDTLAEQAKLGHNSELLHNVLRRWAHTAESEEVDERMSTTQNPCVRPSQALRVQNEQRGGDE